MSSILARVAAGDPEAVRECMDRYGGLVWTIARRLSPSVEDAEDAVQDAFIDIWKSAPSFDESKASEKTFVAMIARRRLIDRLRKRERRPDMKAVSEPPVDFVGDDHEALDRGVEAALAARTLKQLRPEQRRVIGLSVYYGMSHREIAEAMQMPVGTVKSHIWRGLAAVRESLARTGVEGEGGTS